MKTNFRRSGFTLLEIMVLVAILGFLAAIAIPSARAQTTAPPAPPNITAELPTPVDTNGLSFTNVSLQFNVGYEYQGNVGGASAGFVAAQYDLWQTKNVDLGFGGSAVLANTQDAIEKIDVDFDLIKNLDSFQLVGKIIPVGRQFSDSPGYYFGLGGDINYNLTRGLGILGTKSGFTYVSAGYRFEKSFDSVKDNKFAHLVRLSVGYAF